MWYEGSGDYISDFEIVCSSNKNNMIEPEGKGNLVFKEKWLSVSSLKVNVQIPLTVTVSSLNWMNMAPAQKHTQSPEKTILFNSALHECYRMRRIGKHNGRSSRGPGKLREHHPNPARSPPPGSGHSLPSLGFLFICIDPPQLKSEVESGEVELLGPDIRDDRRQDRLAEWAPQKHP